MRATAMQLIVLFLFLSWPFSSAHAVEVAPRISDREIIERLSRLEEGQKQFQAQMNRQFDAINQRFEAVNQRFETVNQRFEAVNQRFETMQQRVDQRFDDLKWFLGIMMGVLIMMNSAVLGYVLKRLGKVETSLETIRDEVTFLKSVIERLLPAKP